eukprot:1195026-Prorocentrum_minimum.AAC.1
MHGVHGDLRAVQKSTLGHSESDVYARGTLAPGELDLSSMGLHKFFHFFAEVSGVPLDLPCAVRPSLLALLDLLVSLYLKRTL